MMTLNDIKDIKPPVYFPSNYLPLVIVVVLCALAAAVFFVNNLIRKKIPEKPPVSEKTAYETACEVLEALKAKGLIRLGKIKEYYVELSLIVRRYLENKFNIKAPEMTTEEFLDAAKQSDELSAGHKELLKIFLSHADMVKFAKYGPDIKEAEGSFLAAKTLIDETSAVIEEEPAK